MIKLIMSRYFDSISCIVSCLVDHIDTPNSRAKELIAMHYRGEGESR